jgi:hypothetical protein
VGPQTGWRWVRLSAGVVLPLLLGVLAAPGTARATCGDYVLLGGHPVPAATPEAPPAPPQPGPCSGPLCSRPTSLPLSPVSTAPAPVEDRCCPPPPLLLDDCQAVARLLERSCPKPSRSSVAVYHPPRPFAVCSSFP